MSYSVPYYETGSWTPTLLGSSSNPTVTYTTQSGTYARIGRAVLINARIDIASISGGSGNALIGGFPYTSTGVEGDRGIFMVGAARNFTSSTTPVSLWMNVTATTATVYTRGSADARDSLLTNVAVTAFTASPSSLIVFGGCYFV